MIRSALTVATLAALLAAGVPSASGADPSASLPDIEDEVMCPICGTLLSHSEAPQADRERALIRKLLARGETKEEIKDALVAQYGPRVLATPGGEGFDLLAWIIPGLAILAAAVAIGFGLRRTLRSPPPSGPGALDPADAERLDTELMHRDL
jgi:cytochrome c-type biogenesis protein CcmH